MKNLSTLAALLMSAFLFAACENDGPFENAGEEIDEAADEVGDSLEDAGDEIEDEIE